MDTQPQQPEPPDRALAPASLALAMGSLARRAQLLSTSSAWHVVCGGSFANHAFQDKPMDANLVVKSTPSDLVLVETSDNRMLRPGEVLAQLAAFLFLQDRAPSGVQKQVGARS